VAEAIFSQLSGYSMFNKHNPWPGAVGPAWVRSRLASVAAIFSTGQCPRPISTIVPTMLRTI